MELGSPTSSTSSTTSVGQHGTSGATTTTTSRPKAQWGTGNLTPSSSPQDANSPATDTTGASVNDSGGNNNTGLNNANSSLGSGSISTPPSQQHQLTLATLHVRHHSFKQNNLSLGQLCPYAWNYFSEIECRLICCDCFGNVSPTQRVIAAVAIFSCTPGRPY